MRGRRGEPGNGVFLHREWVAQDVVAKLFTFGTVLRRDGVAGVHAEAGVFGGIPREDSRTTHFGGDEFAMEQFGEALPAGPDFPFLLLPLRPVTISYACV